MVFASSCTLFKSKNKLLCADQWILQFKVEQTYNNKSSTNKKYFKISEKELALWFKDNGLVAVVEKNDKKLNTIKWKWLSDKKEYLVLYNGVNSNKFHVTDLSNSELVLIKHDEDITKLDMTFYYFYHSDNPELSDKMVEMMNKMSNNE